MRSLHERAAEIDWLLMDVDGVLTDGSIVYSDLGAEVKAFHVRDGSGLALWVKAGKKAGILTGRSSSVVHRRAAELGMELVIQGASDKLTSFRQVVAQRALDPKTICYVGDDLVDVPVMRQCGLAVAVADACEEARTHAHYVTCSFGGRGAVRETIEFLLRAQGLWQSIVACYTA